MKQGGFGRGPLVPLKRKDSKPAPCGDKDVCRIGNRDDRAAAKRTQSSQFRREVEIGRPHLCGHPPDQQVGMGDKHRFGENLRRGDAAERLRPMPQMRPGQRRSSGDSRRADSVVLDLMDAGECLGIFARVRCEPRPRAPSLL
jgi:hypothetical protein